MKRKIPPNDIESSFPPTLNASLAAKISSEEGDSVTFKTIIGSAEGFEEGEGDDRMEDIADGNEDGIADGNEDGIVDGTPDGMADGNSDFAASSLVASPPGIKLSIFTEGMEDGVAEGIIMEGIKLPIYPDGIEDGLVEGMMEGRRTEGVTCEGNPDGTVDGIELGKEETTSDDEGSV
jgi:hypothetical protein